MFFAKPDYPWLFVVLFIVANLGYEQAQGFYNAFLPEIADDEHMGRVSSWGYGAGYVGGGVLLLIVMILFLKGDDLGLPTEDGFRSRLSLLFMGLWWAVFSLPILLFVRDKQAPVARTAADLGRRSSRDGRSLEDAPPIALLSHAGHLSARLFDL